jgi:hypothetical protein
MPATLKNDTESTDGVLLLSFYFDEELNKIDFPVDKSNYNISIKESSSGQYLQTSDKAHRWDTTEQFFTVSRKYIDDHKITFSLPSYITRNLLKNYFEFTINTDQKIIRDIFVSATEISLVNLPPEDQDSPFPLNPEILTMPVKEIVPEPAVLSENENNLQDAPEPISAPPPTNLPPLPFDEPVVVHQPPIPLEKSTSAVEPLPPEPIGIDSKVLAGPGPLKQKSSFPFLLLVIGIPLLLLLGGAATLWYFKYYKPNNIENMTAQKEETPPTPGVDPSNKEDEEKKSIPKKDEDPKINDIPPSNGGSSSSSNVPGDNSGNLSAADRALELLRTGSPSTDDLIDLLDKLEGATDPKSVKASFEITKELVKYEPKYYVNLGSYYDPVNKAIALPEGLTKDAFIAWEAYIIARENNILLAEERLEDLRNWAQSLESGSHPRIQEFRQKVK